MREAPKGSLSRVFPRRNRPSRVSRSGFAVEFRSRVSQQGCLAGVFGQVTWSRAPAASSINEQKPTPARPSAGVGFLFPGSCRNLPATNPINASRCERCVALV